MSTDDLNKYFEVAKAVALDAGKLIKEAFSAKKEVKTKDCFADLVTETDENVEKIVISTLKSSFPSHDFFGEESVAAGLKVVVTDNPTWVIDPVDGTTNFVHSFPYVAISIALLINKKPVVGIVYNPVVDDFYSAKRGQGAFCNGQKLRANDTSDLSKALVCAEFGSSRATEVMDKRVRSMYNVIMKAHGIRCMGSAALNLCMVASGKADAYFEAGPHCWDFAAGALIAEEAGAVAYDIKGGELDLWGRSVLCAATPTLAQQMVSLIDEHQFERD